MAEKYELAYHDYKAGMKQKEIAAKYDVSLNTVKSWQQRKWKQMDVEGANEKVCTPNEGMHTEKDVRQSEVKVIEEPPIEIFSNGELSEKQSLFCWYFTQSWNQTKAYMKAYGVDRVTASANAYRVMANDGVKREIDRLKQQIANGLHVTRAAIIQKWIDIAFADLGDYLEYGNEEITLRDEEGLPLVDENGDPQTYIRSYVRLKDSGELDNSIVTEVKQGKDGISLKLADKMKALDHLAKYLDVLSDNERAKYEEERRKATLAIEKTEIEIEKSRGNTDKQIEIVIRGKQQRDGDN